MHDGSRSLRQTTMIPSRIRLFIIESTFDTEVFLGTAETTTTENIIEALFFGAYIVLDLSITQS